MKPTVGYVYHAKCVRVVDGDTMDVDVDVGFHLTMRMRLRLLRVNTPELTSADAIERTHAQQAKAYVDALLTGKPIVIQTQKADAFGRYLAEVWCEDTNVSDELLGMGLARPYTRGA